MSKVAILNIIGKGDLAEGYSGSTPLAMAGVNKIHSQPLGVIAQIYDRFDDVNLFAIQLNGTLPPASELTELYRRWQILYNLLHDSLIPNLAWRQRLQGDIEIEIESEGVTNISTIEFNQLCEDLKNSLNAWLDSAAFANLEQKLRTKLNPNEEIQVIIQTDLDEIRRLPWNLWDFFEDYSQAVLCLSVPEFERLERQQAKPARHKIRILAVLGNSENIDIQTDRTILENLSGAETTFLVEPQRQELDAMLWDKKGWDILFFAGHSSSQADGKIGQIYINSHDSLSIEQLKNGLKAAISRGLRLAIFNSCDGLGLATQLASLHIPQMIVMREVVPDLVAQRFLKFFLSAFSECKSFYLSVREAGERLQGLEAEFPCASWLPVICQNPTELPLSWKNPHKTSKNSQDCKLPPRRMLPVILGLNLAIVTAIMGGRSLGLFQGWELTAFDTMMRSRPDEGKDERILIVEITEADVQAQNPVERGGASLSDRVLAKSIEQLEKYNPRVVALDIYREHPIPAKYADLARWVQTSPKFIGVCKACEDNKEPGVPATSGIKEENLGFSDVVEDNDSIFRRHLLAMTPTQVCSADKSFSWQIATRYLAGSNIELQLNSQANSPSHQINFPYLQDNSGGYNQIDSRGYQIMLNWRSNRELATRVTLQDLLNGRVKEDLIRGKIVIIGTTAKSFQDYWLTPYSAGTSPQTKIPGVIIHAHMVSQLISAALDRRPLLWVWSKWSEALWIYCWAIVGAMLAWRCKSTVMLFLILALAQILLCSCYILLINGAWVPLIPSMLAIVSSSGSIVIYTKFHRKAIGAKIYN
jgi:CHASE2 domain-containing sensor protein